MNENSYSQCIDLNDFLTTSLVNGFAVTPDSLNDGQIMVSVDKVALTSNSVSYVIGSQSGMMPWLDLFPAPEGKGHIPCWGFGDVIYSKNPDIPTGERLYGFFPIASHLICSPGLIHENGFTDTAVARNGVAPFYNEYRYISNEKGYVPEFEDSMMLFRPLFATSYLLESFCEDQNFFDRTDQIIVSSASSKTAMGFGYLLRKNHGHQVKAIGLTSSRNKDFVVGLDCYDEVITYEDVATLNPRGEAAYFDVAGNREVTTRIHQQLGDTLIYSGQVGQTHWTDKDKASDPNLRGPKVVMWSGPDQVMLLRERYGEQGFMRNVQSSMIDFMTASFSWLEVVHATGPEAVDARVKSMLQGEINANEGIALVL